MRGGRTSHRRALTRFKAGDCLGRPHIPVKSELKAERESSEARGLKQH